MARPRGRPPELPAARTYRGLVVEPFRRNIHDLRAGVRNGWVAALGVNGTRKRCGAVGVGRSELIVPVLHPPPQVVVDVDGCRRARDARHRGRRAGPGVSWLL